MTQAVTSSPLEKKKASFLDFADQNVTSIFIEHLALCGFKTVLSCSTLPLIVDDIGSYFQLFGLLCLG